MNDSELDIKRSTLYYLYLIKREKFKQWLRELFLSNSVVTSISKYIKWRREYDAGLATAWLMLYDWEESNSFWGRSLKLPIVHRFNVIQKLIAIVTLFLFINDINLKLNFIYLKLWNLSEISWTHTTYSDISCTSSEHDPDEYYLNNEEEESIFNEPLWLNQSLSLPSIKMLEPDEINNKNTMYSIKNNLFSDNSIKFNGKTVEFVDTENLSESTN